MSIKANTVGGPLDDIYKDMKLLPTNVLQGYLQNPNNMQADGVSFSLMAGGVLADRARQQAAFAASQQPNPAQIPTVAQTLAQGQPVGVAGVPAGGAGITAFSTQLQQQLQQGPQSQQITLNPAKQATPISLATPYAAAKTPLQQKVSAAPTATRNMAQGGIVAFQEGGMPIRPERDAGRVAELDFDEALLRDAELDPKLKDPATREALMQAMRADAAAGKQFSYKPKAEAAGLGSLRELLRRETPKLYEQAGINKTFSSDQEAAARKAAVDRLQGATNPRMAELQKLIEAQSGIANRGQGDKLSEFLVRGGASLLKSGRRPSSMAYGLGEVAELGAGMYRQNLNEQVARELEANKLQIKLQEQLMRQGVDEITAGDAATKEARRVFEIGDKEGRDTAKSRYEILKGGATVEADAERENRLRTAEVRREQELQARLARGNDRRLTDAERAHSRRAAGYIRQGFSTEVADGMAQSDVDQMKILPTEARLSQAAQEALARAKIFDPIWRSAKTPEEKAKREEELLKIIQAQQPTRPGATPATSSAKQPSANVITNPQFPGFSIGKP